MKGQDYCGFTTVTVSASDTRKREHVHSSFSFAPLTSCQLQNSFKDFIDRFPFTRLSEHRALLIWWPSVFQDPVAHRPVWAASTFKPNESLCFCCFIGRLCVTEAEEGKLWDSVGRFSCSKLKNVVPHFDAVLIAWPLTRWVIRGYQSNQVSSWQQKVYWRNQSSVLNCKICKVLFLF